MIFIINKNNLLILLFLVLLSRYVFASNDPFEDKHLSCDEISKYQERIFVNGIDLGSGHGSPISVDYNCEDSLTSKSFLSNLYKLTEEIRSERGPQTCTGSIIYAHWRYYHFSLLEAGYYPSNLIANVNSNALLSNSPTFNYFKRWSVESSYNYDLFNKYNLELAKVRPLLKDFYIKNHKIDNQLADAVTDSALMIFLRRAAGSYPSGDNLDYIFPLLKTIYDDSYTEDDLQNLISSTPSEEERIVALKAALLHNYPTHIIHMLATSIKDFDKGDESVLFFSTNSIENTELLLGLNLNVNHQNAFGKTALYYAIQLNQPDVVELLLKSGANVNHKYKSKKDIDKLGWMASCTYQIRHTKRTPLMHAAQHADVKMLEILIKNNADPKMKDELGDTALQYAVRANNLLNIEFLKKLNE